MPRAERPAVRRRSYLYEHMFPASTPPHRQPSESSALVRRARDAGSRRRRGAGDLPGPIPPSAPPERRAEPARAPAGAGGGTAADLPDRDAGTPPATAPRAGRRRAARRPLLEVPATRTHSRTTMSRPGGRLIKVKPAATYSPRPEGPSTIGAEGLNCSVRNGKRCFPLASTTGTCRDHPSRRPLKTALQPNQETGILKKNRQALGRLVPVTFTRCRASSSGLSTWWSTRVLTPSKGMGEFISRPASRLDAFSGYPIRS